MELLCVTVGYDAGVTGDRIVSIQNKRFEDLHVLNNKGATLENSISVSTRKC